MEENLAEEQFVLKRNRGTRNVIGQIRILDDTFIEKRKNICMCFIDLDKAFDNIMLLLKKKRRYKKNKRFIGFLYMNQKVSVGVK